MHTKSVTSWAITWKLGHYSKSNRSIECSYRLSASYITLLVIKSRWTILSCPDSIPVFIMDELLSIHIAAHTTLKLPEVMFYILSCWLFNNIGSLSYHEVNIVLLDKLIAWNIDSFRNHEANNRHVEKLYGSKMKFKVSTRSLRTQLSAAILSHTLHAATALHSGFSLYSNLL